MNILNILYTFNPGGVERLAIDVCNEMARTGNNVHLCVISDNYTESLLAQLRSSVVQHRLTKATRMRKLSYLKQVLQIIDHDKIEAVHIHQGTLMPFYTVVKLLRPKVRFYFTSHATYIFSELSPKNQRLCRMVCNKIIAISDAVEDDILSCGVGSSHVSRVYNGVNFSKFPLFNRRTEAGRILEIVNVARFTPEVKGQDILIKAAAILQKRGYKFHLSFAGGEITSEGQEIPKMKSLAQELGVAEHISFLGNVTDVYGLLKKADLFCIPSRCEGFGISAVEAMGTGLPCVASDIVGLNEVVNDPALGLLFEADHAEDLADKLETMINHIHDYSPVEIAENVRSRFSIESMASDLLAVYRS